MNKKNPDNMPLVDDTEAASCLVATIAAKPYKGLNFTITLNDKTLTVSNVPMNDNSTRLHANIISMYSGLSDGEYQMDGTDIKVIVKSL